MPRVEAVEAFRGALAGEGIPALCAAAAGAGYFCGLRTVEADGGGVRKKRIDYANAADAQLGCNPAEHPVGLLATPVKSRSERGRLRRGFPDTVKSSERTLVNSTVSPVVVVKPSASWYAAIMEA
jgi:hypothetical protein